MLIVIDGVEVYPTPGLLIKIVATSWFLPIDEIPTAVSPIPMEPFIVTIGDVEYPTPPSLMINLIIPLLTVSIEQVAAAPEPPPPDIVIIGGIVYPIPELTKRISLTEKLFPLLIILAIAEALLFGSPVGDVEIETIGAVVYP